MLSDSKVFNSNSMGEGGQKDSPGVDRSDSALPKLANEIVEA